MTDSRWGSLGFGLYDFFAYILPASLLLAPAVFLTEPILDPGVSAAGGVVRNFAQAEGVSVWEGAAVSFLGLALLYAAGLALHSIARWSEMATRKRQKEGPHKGKPVQPSALILDKAEGALRPPVAAEVRAQAVRDFGVGANASASQVWALAYRFLAQEGLMGRTLQFLYLHTLTRALSLTTFAWALYFLVRALVLWSWVPLVLAVGLAGLTALFWFLRKSYDEAVAEEVYAAYYVARRTRA